MSADFIEMIVNMNERRYSGMIQTLTTDKTPCGILFAPGVPANARQIVDYLKSGGLNLNCVCVLVEEHKQFFQPVDGENLVALEEFPTLDDKPKFIFALGGFFQDMFMDYFARHGTKTITTADFNDMENSCNFYMQHLPELYTVHEMFADDESKKAFRASIIGKVTGLLNDFRFAPEPQYFLNGFLPKDGDIAIDGGAYDGATATDFARQGAQVYAFEMNAENYKNCLAPAEKFGFTIENFGLSNRAEEAAYIYNGAGSRKLAEGIPGGGEI